MERHILSETKETGTNQEQGVKGKTNKKCKENKLLKMWMKRMVKDTVSALPPIFSSCFPADHSCFWVERGLVNIKCLSQEHNTLQLSYDLNPGSSIPGQHSKR